MNYLNFISKGLILLAIPALFACEGNDDDDNSPVVNETELITVLNITLINPVTFDTTYAVFSDPDGPGGIPPTITPIILKYTGTDDHYYTRVEVLDSSNPNNIKDITPEIIQEAEMHQFFYLPNESAAGAVSISYDPQENTDSNGNPIGILTQWTVLGPATEDESVTIVLRHAPNKSGAGVSAGDISNAGGETDIEITFQLEIQD